MFNLNVPLEMLVTVHRDDDECFVGDTRWLSPSGDSYYTYECYQK